MSITRQNAWLTIVIVVIASSFILLMVMFALGLKNNPNELDLVTQGEKVPDFSLPSLLSERLITNKDFTTDKPYYLVNVWGTWCPSCRKEHAYLVALRQSEDIYGVNWQDKSDSARNFISHMGNPYKAIVVDEDSQLAIHLGVYGAPETFLVRSDATIVYRYAGPLNEDVWKRHFAPKIRHLEQVQ